MRIHYVINHKLQTTHPQRGDRETTSPTHPLYNHTPLVRTPSDFVEFHTHLQLIKVQLQEP